MLLQRLRPYLQGFFNQYTSALHPLLPCVLPAPCQKRICMAVQPARSGNQGIKFSWQHKCKCWHKGGNGTSSQGRKGPSPSAKTHTCVRLKWSQPQLPTHSPPVSASVGITQQHGSSSCLALQKGCPSKHRAIFTACFFSHQLLLPLKAKKPIE